MGNQASSSTIDPGSNHCQSNTTHNHQKSFPNDSTMNDSTTLTILELQLQDVYDMQNEMTDIGDGSLPNDNRIALDLAAEEMQRNITILKDRIMCRSHARAIESDGHLVSELTDNNNEMPDEALMDRLSELNNYVDMMITTTPATYMDMDHTDVTNPNTERVNSLSIHDEDASNTTTLQLEDLDTREGSRSLDRHNGNHEATKTEVEHPDPGSHFLSNDCDACIACSDIVSSNHIHFAPCPEKHPYCTTCIGRLFKEALTNTSLFPPRCCREPFPLDELKYVVGPDIIRCIQVKTIEMATTERTYCSDPECAEFILPDTIVGDTALCASCFRPTCAKCKKLFHAGDCKESTTDDLVLKTAAEAGWRRCYQCRTMVELTIGCNHITCVCRAEFCYVCGLVWKTCQCPIWDEERLLAQANAVVARAAPEVAIARGGVMGIPRTSVKIIIASTGVGLEFVAGTSVMAVNSCFRVSSCSVWYAIFSGVEVAP